MKSFMEELRDSKNAASTAAAHVVAGATHKNQGGRGVQKGCVRCRLAGRDPTGHRKRNCPFNANSETDDEIRARRKAAKKRAAEEAQATGEAKQEEEEAPEAHKNRKRKVTGECHLSARDTTLTHAATPTLTLSLPGEEHSPRHTYDTDPPARWCSREGETRRQGRWRRGAIFKQRPGEEA